MSLQLTVSDREFAALASDVKYLAQSVAETRASVKEIDTKMDGLRSLLDQAGGGIRVAMAVSGFMGAFVMLLITKVLPLLFAGLPRL